MKRLFELYFNLRTYDSLSEQLFPFLKGNGVLLLRGFLTRIENKILSLGILHFSFYRPSEKLNFRHLLIRKANFFLLSP